MYFLVFHGEERFRHKPHPGEHDHADEHGHVHVHEPHESPGVVWWPLVLLAVPSVLIGFFTMAPMLVGDFFRDAITVDAARHPAMAAVAEHAGHAVGMAMHGLVTLPFWLAVAGVVVSGYFYLKAPHIPAAIGRTLSPIVKVLENKYYLDWFNEHVLAAGTRLLGRGLWKGGDQGLIDGLLVNGSARLVGVVAGLSRLVQTGHVYWYALVMLLGVFGLLSWQLWPEVLGPFLSRLGGR
jgi:NADH-quinone oxidoreductase subunit L